MSCSQGNCGCGASCSCGSGCGGCKMSPDMAAATVGMRVAANVRIQAASPTTKGGFEAATEGGGCDCNTCNCGSSCGCTCCSCN